MTINPIIYEMLMAFVRQGVTVLATWLVAQGFIDEGDTQTVVAGMIMLIVTAGSIAWTVYHKRLKMLAALATPEAMTENQLDAMMKDKSIETPPASKAKDSMPYLKDPSGSRAQYMKK